jgi:uncharacterized small protein (DUF1192 family)
MEPTDDAIQEVVESAADTIEHLDAIIARYLAEIERLRMERADLQVLLKGRTAEFQAEIERLDGERDAIDALHQPDPDYYSPRDRQMCLNCDLEWPCPTYELLHPEEARRG